MDEADKATSLLEYSEDLDEPTGKHEVTVNLNNPHPPSPSQPQIEVDPAKPGVLTIVFTTVQKFPPWGAVLVALAALASYVYLKAIGAIK